MTIRLNRAMFRRLVQLYIATGIASLGLATFEITGPGWASFSNDFDALVVQHFGDQVLPDLLVWLLSAIVIAGGLWMVASMLGLLRFKRWARTGIWASMLVILVSYAAIARTEPMYSTPIYDLLAAIDSALLGAIVILAYASGLGDDWFARQAD